MAPYISVRWRPGEFFSYANPGHVFAAAALEAACECEFDRFLEDEVFAPLGMSGATFRNDEAATESLVQSYLADGFSPHERWLMLIRPAGSLIMGLDDLEAMLQFYVQRGATAPAFLPAESLAAMEPATDSVLARAGLPLGYGLGNFGFVAGRDVFHGHTGSTEGFRAWFGYHPPTRSGFAFVLSGGEENARYRLMRRIGDYLTRELPEPMTPPAVAFSDTSAEGWWAPFTHSMLQRDWLWRLFGAGRLSVAGDGLQLTHYPPFSAAAEWTHVGNGLLRPAGSAFASAGLIPDADGDLRLLVGTAYEPVPAWQVWLPRAAVLVALLASALAILWLPMVAFVGRAGLAAPVALITASGASLLGLGIYFLFAGMLGPLQSSAALGRVSVSSVALLVMSLAGPSLALAGYWRLRGLAGSLSQRLLLGLLLGVGLGWALLTWQGWVPLITWRI